MSAKQLITLAAIAGVLVVVLLIQHFSKGTADIEEELSLAALAPEGFLVSDVSRVEVYRGAKQDEKVLLARQEDAWVVESRFGAPGKKDKIEGFLKKMKGLEGELRSESADVLEDFDITGEKALHVAVFRKDHDEAWYHLLIGKKETYNRSFVRLAQADVVYSVDVNLLSELGIWGDDSEKAPESKEWLDKTIVDLDKDKITRIALKTPDRSLAFEKREKKKEDVEKKEEDQENEGAAGKEAEKKDDKKDEKKEFEWVLAEGGPGLAGAKPDADFKQSGIDDILRALDSFEAEDVEDPGKKTDLGLDEPNFRCAVALEGGRETVLLASREKPGDDAFLMLEGKPFIFKVSDWKFDDLFPAGKGLFDLPGLDEQDDKVKSITLTYPGLTIELARGDDGWALKSPDTGLQFKKDEAGDIARELASWKPSDYADDAEPASFGLDMPHNKAVFVLDDGKTHALSLGAESRGVEEGRYALLDDMKRVLVASKWDAERLFPEPKEFFELKVPDIDKFDVTKVSVERKEAPFAVEKKDDEWTLSSAGETLEPDDAGIDDYLALFEDLEADDLLLSADPPATEDKVTVTIEFGDDEPLTLSLLGEKDGRRAVLVSGVKATLLFPRDKVDKLAPSPQELAGPKAADEPEKKEPKPEEKAEEKPDETPEADAAKPAAEGPVEPGKKAEELPPVEAAPPAGDRE